MGTRCQGFFLLFHPRPESSAYKVAIELLFALVKMNVEGEKGTFKPTFAAKTRHSTQRNLGVFWKLVLSQNEI